MAVIRKRLIFWLIKAYIKKWGKTILFSFLAGLIIFFALLLISKYYSRLIPLSHTQTIGIVGAYIQDSLPSEITDKISSGLTTIGSNGAIQPGLASSWDILDKGKTYRFHLKHGMFFSDGQAVTSQTVNYNFSDVSETTPDKYTIIFTLKDAYAPFLVTVSKPVFDRGFSGVGNYRLTKINTSANFVQSLTLVSRQNVQDVINYEFYPTEDSLKTAYLLGEISQIENLSAGSFNSFGVQKFTNTTYTKSTDYSQLVTLFFNNDDGDLSNKKLRLSLMYAIPSSFQDGKKASSPYSPFSIYYNKDLDARSQDFAHAKLLLNPSATSSLSGQVKLPATLTIKTDKKYDAVAQSIASAWSKLGVKIQVEDVYGIPNDFQIYLGDFSIPEDPDQYTLWHSDGPDNITHYKNLRIDELLEDGRKTVDVNQRKTIYSDFQKYLLEDAPAVFLYYPTEYTITRK